MEFVFSSSCMKHLEVSRLGHYAAACCFAHHQVDLIDLFLRAGANLNAEDTVRPAPTRPLAKDAPAPAPERPRCREVFEIDRQIRSPLQFAPFLAPAMPESSNELSMIKRLTLCAAPNPHLPQTSLSSLHLAAAAASDVDAEVINLLVRGGADISRHDEMRHTPLHYAAGAGSAVRLRALLAHGAAQDARRFDGKTPLHLSAWHGLEESAAILIQSGADPLAADSVRLARTRSIRSYLHTTLLPSCLPLPLPSTGATRWSLAGLDSVLTRSPIVPLPRPPPGGLDCAPLCKLQRPRCGRPAVDRKRGGS